MKRKMVTKHIFTAEGRYIGCKRIPYWQTKIRLPVILLCVISILIAFSMIHHALKHKQHNHGKNVFTISTPF
jgi:hypothetical protein